ncbi:MAG: tRNA (N6-isopentenyl adenosine(37)-C2)-methylthiotransferase MiaB [Nitrospinae bacterium]|nr:tRNA (N6-isopentenyl adenosine(37)-C2)-methylthiotransferase MiaB [Nitrospinota bacterium]
MDFKRKKLSIVTLGCQMNRHDSEWIAGLLADEYDVTGDEAEADLLVVNTCAVRDKAEQKFFSLMGRLRPLKAGKRDMVIGVAGCVAQEQGEQIIKRQPLVDIVFGTKAVEKLPSLLKKFEETGRPQVDVSAESDYDEYPMKRESAVSAWVSIMRGCGNHCSYCIVPSTRGAEQSRPMESILAEIRDLAEKGYKEITLLGQNVNSYGAGLSQKATFPELLRKADAIMAGHGGGWLRFVTSHPKDLSDDLIAAMAELESVCPALHLPIQSGSDRILAAMRRGYTAERYFERVENLRRKIPDLALTSDVIVGFPGETQEDFEATLKAVEQAEYDNIFLFKYSPREGTDATKLPGRVDANTARERFDAVMDIQRDITRRRYESWTGKEITALTDGPSKRDPLRYSARTPQNITVNFGADMDFTGSFIRARIIKAKRYSLDGSINGQLSQRQAR